MKQFSHHQGQADQTLFTKHAKDGKRSFLIVYVDNTIITSDDIQEIELMNNLKAEFEVKDLGNLRYFLGMDVARSKHGIDISQKKYTPDHLKEIGKLGNNQQEHNWR